MFGEWQVSVTIKYVSGDTADDELGAEERQVAVFQEAGHQRVAFGGDVQANPDERKLGVDPVQNEE